MFKFGNGNLDPKPPAFVCGCTGSPVYSGDLQVCDGDLSDLTVSCDRSCPDCGPYTPIQYDRRYPPVDGACSDYLGADCPGDTVICPIESQLPARFPMADHPSPPDPLLTDEELVAWKSMELEIYAQALKGELYVCPVLIPSPAFLHRRLEYLD